MCDVLLICTFLCTVTSCWVSIMYYMVYYLFIYSETCLSGPLTVPEKVVNISKWSTYTNMSQNNFQSYSYFISSLTYSSVLTILSIIYISGSQTLQYLKVWQHT